MAPTFLPLVGGAEVGLREIFTRMALRHTVHLVTPMPPGAQTPELSAIDTTLRDQHRLNVVRYRDRITGLVPWLQWLSLGLVPPFSVSCAVAVRDACAQLRPDVANVHYAMHSGLSVPYLRHLGIPVLLSLVGRDVPGPGQPPLRRAYVNLVAARSTSVTVISDYCRAQVNSGCAPILTIPYGVDVQRFLPGDIHEARARLGIPSDSNTVLFALQRLEKGKRVDILLEAVARMVREGISIHLYVGGDGRKRRELELLRDTLGLSDHVTFAGHIPDEALPGYYRMADIFVLHSSYETFGVVLAEAMATGKPIVSVTAGGIPDVVEPGSEGLLVPPLDPDALAQALMRLVGDSALRLRMGRAGREKAVRLFAWERIVAQYEEALDCVIARGAAARRRKVARHGANTT